MQYLHPEWRLRDHQGELARSLAARPARLPASTPAYELGRIGGEMARFMVDAALIYLTEKAKAEAKKSFIRNLSR